MQLSSKLNSFYKKTLVVRTDLGMTKGKIAAQVKDTKHIEGDIMLMLVIVWSCNFSLL